MKASEFLSGQLNLGVLGQRTVFVFTNMNKKDIKSPDFLIMTSGEEGKPMNRVGVLWKKEEKAETPSSF